jgi:hypothetical protein
VQPSALVTVKVYIPDPKFVTVVPVPVPEVVVPPGFCVNIQVPEEGKLLNTTLPGLLQLDGVIVPTVGAAAGVEGMITASADEPDMPHPAVTLKE